jgi:hypothetical protein
MSILINDELETIDSTAMQILGDFECQLNDAETVRCFIKADDYWLVCAIGSATEAIGHLAFERTNIELVNQKLDEVLAGKLFNEELDFIAFESGKDEIQISASTVFPSNSVTPRETITVLNLREMELDGLEFSTGLSLSPKSAETLSKELAKLSKD